MKNKTLTGVLALFFYTAFGAAAIFMFWILANTQYMHFNSKDWVEIPISSLKWDLKSYKSSKNNINSTQKIVTEYTFTYKNKQYTGKTTDLTTGADSFSDKDRNLQLSELSSNKKTTVYVNSNNPEQNALWINYPTAQTVFFLIFLIIPCGLGTIAIVTALLWPLNKITNNKTATLTFPIWGLLHGAGALYPIWIHADMSWFQTIVLYWFALQFIYCMYLLVKNLFKLNEPQNYH